MLDNLKYIHERDVGDMLGVSSKQGRQLGEDFELRLISFKPENIVFCGMGGSALSGLISKAWPGYKIPFEVVRSSHIPKHVSKKTLFIASSYSGNTVETLSALAEAEDKNAYICLISSGGKLAEIAKSKHYPLVSLKGGLQPRSACLFSLKALVTILAKLKLVDEAQISEDIMGAIGVAGMAGEEFQSVVPTANNLAKQIANEVAGKSVVIYSSSVLFPLAYKWKIDFNENAKQIAWCNEYPEFAHNEFIGWSEQPDIKPYCVIRLRSQFDDPLIVRDFELTARLLSGKMPSPIDIDLRGSNLLEEIVYGLVLGDMASIYSALIAGINPEPITLVEKLKKEIGH